MAALVTWLAFMSLMFVLILAVNIVVWLYFKWRARVEHHRP